MRTKSLHLVILLIMQLSFPSAESCTCYDVRDGDGYLYLCHEACRTSWDGAERYCRNTYGGHLATLLDANSQETLYQYLSTHGFGDTWIGAKGAKGDWQWITSKSPLFKQGCFVDDPANRDLNYELRLNQGVTADNCIEGCRNEDYTYAGVQGGTMCFCGNEYGQYGATVGCDVECFMDSSQNCGGYNKNFVYNVYGSSNVSKWSSGYPSAGIVDDKECLALVCDTKYEDYGWYWKARKCSDVTKYFCETDLNATGECPEAYMMKIGDKCVFYKEWNYGSWFGARQDCIENNSRLMEMKTEKEFQDLTSTIECWQESFWLGASKVEWTWATGEEMVYTSWATGSPANEGEKCVAMSYRLSNQYEWSDVKCNQPLEFVCQSGKPTTTSTTVPTTTTTVPSTTTETTTPTSTTASSSASSSSTSPSSPPSTITEQPLNATVTAAPPPGGLTTNQWVGVGVAIGLVAVVLIIIVVLLLIRRSRKDKREDTHLVAKDGQRAENGYVKKAAFIKDNDFNFVNSQPPGINNEINDISSNTTGSNGDVNKPKTNGNVSFYNYKKQNIAPVWGSSNLMNSDNTTQTDADNLKRKNEKNARKEKENQEKEKNGPTGEQVVISGTPPVVTEAWPNNSEARIDQLKPTSQQTNPTPQIIPYEIPQPGFIGDFSEAEAVYHHPRESVYMDSEQTTSPYPGIVGFIQLDDNETGRDDNTASTASADTYSHSESNIDDMNSIDRDANPQYFERGSNNGESLSGSTNNHSPKGNRSDSEIYEIEIVSSSDESDESLDTKL